MVIQLKNYLFWGAMFCSLGSKYIDCMNALDGLTYIDYDTKFYNKELYNEVSYLEKLSEIFPNNFENIKSLISKKANVNSTFEQGKNVLQLAYGALPCSDEKIQLFDFLIENKIDINHQDMSDNTILHYSVSNDNSNYVDYFLRNGANINSEGRHKRTPLEYSYANKKFELFNLLIEKNADINHRDLYGSTLLHYAAFDKEIAYIERLIKNKDLKIDIENNHGTTALHAAFTVGCLSEIIPMVSFTTMFDIINNENKHMLKIQDFIIEELNNQPLNIFLSTMFFRSNPFKNLALTVLICLKKIEKILSSKKIPRPLQYMILDWFIDENNMNMIRRSRELVKEDFAR